MDLLAGLRLSKHGGELDPSTSPQSQRDDIKAYAAKIPARITIWAEDLDVSAISLDPFERPGIGPWLTPERQHHYQGIIWAHADRGVRSMKDLAALSNFAIKHRKIIYFVNGISGAPFILDYRNGPEDPMVQFMAYMFAFFGEMEANRILSRNRKTKKYLVKNGFWTGGKHLFYLIPTKADGENNQRLIRNPELAPYAEEMIRKAMNKVSAEDIAVWLNSEGIPAPKEAEMEKSKARDKSQARPVSTAPVSGIVTAIEKDHLVITDPTGEAHSVEKSPRGGRWAVDHGEPVAQGERLIHKMVWTGGTVKRTLRSRTLFGETPYDDKTVRDANAAPVLRADPIITREQWERLQHALDGVNRRKYRGRQDSLLLDVGYCAHCNSPLYAFRTTRVKTGGEYGYYRCAKTTIPKARKVIEGTCIAKYIRINKLDLKVEDLLLDIIGPHDRLARMFVPGVSFEAELLETKSQLRDTIKMSAGKSPAVQEVYTEEIEALEARIEELSSAPTRDAGYETRSVGTTYAEDWTKQGTLDQRMMLIEAGIKVYAATSEEQPDWTKVSMSPETDIIRFSYDRGMWMAMAIPKDIAPRALGRNVDLGFTDVPLGGLSQDLSVPA